MNTDIFNNKLPPLDAEKEELKSYYQGSFGERLSRLRKINKIFPFGRREFGSDESNRIFAEAIHCYILGQYVAVIVLAQSFIERRFQEYFHIRLDEKRSKYTLFNFIEEFKGSNFLPDYILEKVDSLRLKRNPFIHHRLPLQKDTLMARSFKFNVHPEELLEKDALDAIELMFYFVRLPIL